MKRLRSISRADRRRDAYLASLDAALFAEASDRGRAANDAEPMRGSDGPVDAVGDDSKAVDWRSFAADVRALAPPIDPDFERRLQLQLAERSNDRTALGTRSAARAAESRRPLAARLRRAAPATRLPRPSLGGSRLPRPSLASRLRRPVLASRARRAIALGGPTAVALGIAVLVVVLSSSQPRRAAGVSSGAGSQRAGSAATAAPRLRARGASITLTPARNRVQSASDAAARLASRQGGYVLSSHVESRLRGVSEAELILSVPSGKLAATLAALGRLAPIGAESQSLQDITGRIDSIRAELREARTDRAALLRALAAAEGEARIERLRRQLMRERSANSRDESALRSIVRQAHNAQIEVTIRGCRHAAASGISIEGGLHDALRVLTVAFVVMLVAGAALAPLALLTSLAITALRAWKRVARERVLDASEAG